ncbi:MAG TPA: hypothetical protein VFI33_16145 [Puia sp.]|nr:hypothetical protein [Puia sp.]
MSQIIHSIKIHPLQNRVDPFAQLIRTSARGAWMGNRGLIHNEHQQIIRPFRLKAWITCLLEFKDRHRAVMTPNLYTELFFLDEATAFSSGHRPCAECRRADFNLFKAAWVRGNPLYMYNTKTPIGEVDEILHRERMNPNGDKSTYREILGELPEGSFIEYNGRPYMIGHSNSVIGWTPFGYTDSIYIPPSTEVSVLTPKSIVNAFRSGYLPQIHKSAR